MNALVNAIPSQTMSSLELTEQLITALQVVIKKINAGEHLTIEDQCVLMVAATATASDLGYQPTQEYFNDMQKNKPINMHAFIEKFISAFPTKAQARLMQIAAVNFGYNEDGTINEALSEFRKGRSSRGDSSTYIVRKIGTTEIKIGRSRHPKKRINTIEMQSGARLEVLTIISEDIESKLHRKFADIRTVGEWFNDVDGVIAKFALECAQ